MSPYYVGATLRVKGDESGVTYTIEWICSDVQSLALAGPDGAPFLINIEAINALMVPA